jgi:hypothetical protein
MRGDGTFPINWRVDAYLIVRREDIKAGEADRASRAGDAANGVRDWGRGHAGAVRSSPRGWGTAARRTTPRLSPPQAGCANQGTS